MYQILFYLYKQYQEIDRNKVMKMIQAVKRKKVLIRHIRHWNLILTSHCGRGFFTNTGVT